MAESSPKQGPISASVFLGDFRGAERWVTVIAQQGDLTLVEDGWFTTPGRHLDEADKRFARSSLQRREPWREDPKTPGQLWRVILHRAGAASPKQGTTPTERVSRFVDVYESVNTSGVVYSAGSRVSDHETVELTVADLRALLAANDDQRWVAVVAALDMVPEETLEGVLEEISIYREHSAQLDQLRRERREPVSGITEEMIAQAAEGVLNVQVCADTDEPLSARGYAKAALSAALSGRVVATLPAPVSDDEDGKVWRSAAGSAYSAYVDRWQPTVSTPGGDMSADEAEADALALLAAAREARRLAGDAQLLAVAEAREAVDTGERHSLSAVEAELGGASADYAGKPGAHVCHVQATVRATDSSVSPPLCHDYDCSDAPRGSNGVTVVHEQLPSCGQAEPDDEDDTPPDMRDEMPEDGGVECPEPKPIGDWCNCQAIPGTAVYPGPWHPTGDPVGCLRSGQAEAGEQQ